MPVQAATVYAGDQGFAKLGDADLLGAPDSAGYVSSARTFDQVAYVRIVQGAGSAIDVPVPMTAAECELVCKVPVDRGAGDKSDLERRIGYLVDDVRALQALVVDRVHRINELNGAKRYEDALASAREALDLMHKHVPALRRGCGAVDERTTALSLAADPRRAWLAEQLDDIDRQQASLDKLSSNLDSTIRRNDAQSRANVLIELGNQALGQGNADEAIDKYTLALGEQSDQPGLVARLAALKKTWAAHGPEHEAARRFAYQTWPITELAQIEARLPDAEKAEDRFEQVGDGYSAIKLLKTNEQLLADLDRLVGELSQRDGEEDRKEHEKYVGVLERLAKLQARVAKFCQSTPLDLAPTTDAANSNGPAGGGQPAPRPAPKNAAAQPASSKPAATHPPDPSGGQPKQKPAVTPPAAADDEEEPPLDR
jgi:tetratricopeptide (TPR) repeat protein